MASAEHRVIIVGAGPSGLCTAYELRRRGIESVVLERGDAPGASFGRMRPSMHLVSPSFFSQLPGLPFPRGSPAFLPMPEFRDYLGRYARHHGLEVRCGADVARAEPGFAVQLASGETLRSRVLVVATGVFSTPYVPPEIGIARATMPWVHAADWRDSRTLAGRDILIVGSGLSAQEIALELSRERPVTMAARHPLRWVPNPVLGIDLHWFAWLPEMVPVRWAPWAVRHAREPASGWPIRAALRSGAVRVVPGVQAVEGERVVLADGSVLRPDALVLATGFRPTIAWLQGMAAADGERIAGAPEGQSERLPGLFFVGFPFLRTFASRYLRGIRRDAAAVARGITRLL